MSTKIPVKWNVFTLTHRQQGSRLNVALVVSIGCGVYPAEALGKVDAHQFLFFGKHWLKAGYEIRKQAKNLLSLLTTAVSSGLILFLFCMQHYNSVLLCTQLMIDNLLI